MPLGSRGPPPAMHPPPDEAWCRNPGCEAHGLGADEPARGRCPVCAARLTVVAVSVPLPAPFVTALAKAAA